MPTRASRYLRSRPTTCTPYNTFKLSNFQTFQTFLIYIFKLQTFKLSNFQTLRNHNITPLCMLGMRAGIRVKPVSGTRGRGSSYQASGSVCTPCRANRHLQPCCEWSGSQTRAVGGRDHRTCPSRVSGGHRVALPGFPFRGEVGARWGAASTRRALGDRQRVAVC